VLSSHAAGQSASPVTHVAKVSVEPLAPEPAPVEIVPSPEPVVTAVNKKSNKLPLIALLILLLLVGVGWFVWMQLKSESATTATVAPQVTQPVIPQPTAPAAPAVLPVPVEPPACSEEAMAKVKDDLIYIQGCLKTSPDSVQVLAVINAAKKSNRCDLAQRLYAFKGQAGDVPVALAYAKEFDPASFTAGCFKAADKETAIYWYEVVLSKDANHAEAKSRLEALRK
jgi:hypothetical protein